MNVKDSLQSFLDEHLYASHYYQDGRIWSTLYLAVGDKSYCLYLDKENCQFETVWKRLDEFYSQVTPGHITYESDDTRIGKMMDAYFKEKKSEA
jgi:hypothetical protein